MIRQTTPHDIEMVLAINNDAVPAVNSLTANELTDIINISEKSWVVDEGDEIVGVLIVIGPENRMGAQITRGLIANLRILLRRPDNYRLVR